MSGNATKAEINALLKRNGNLVTFNPRPQAAPAPTLNAPTIAAGSDFEKQLSLYKATTQPQAQKGGGVLGHLLNNPIGHAVTGALGVLDIPRRMVVSGIHELSDAIGSGDASWNDFANQVKDPTYGVGRYVHTGNKWLDRGIGFAGDVAADPLTYVTLGAGKFAGQSGRVEAALKVAEAVKAGDLGAESVAKIGRLGVLGANDAERAAIFKGAKDAEKLAQPGLRFAGHVIPGTEGLAEKAGLGLSKTRAAIGDTKLGDALRSIRTPKGLENVNGLGNAFKVLAEGKSAEASTRALEQVRALRNLSASERQFVKTFANSADKLAHDIGKTGNGQEVFQALDEGLPLTGLTHADQAHALLSKVHGEASKTVTALGERQNYAPHIFTREGRAALNSEAFAPLRKEVGMDLTEATGGAVRRTIHPGSKLTMPDGSLVEFVADTASGAVSARQINEKLGAHFGGIKFIQDDITKVLKPYIEGIGTSVGRADAVSKAGELSGRGGMVHAVDKVATERAVKAEARDAAKTVKQIEKRLAGQGKELKAAAVTDLQSQLQEATARLSTAQATEKQAIAADVGLRAQRSAVTDQTAGTVSAAGSTVDQKIGAGTEATKAYQQIDAAQEAATKARFGAREDIATAKADVATATSKLQKASRINPNPPKGTTAAYQKVSHDLASVVDLTGPGADETRSLLTAHAEGVADLRDGAAMTKALKTMESAVKSGEVVPVMKKVIADGYEQIGKSLLGEEAPIVRKELARQLSNLNVVIDDPGMWKAMDKYTRYFKTWATSTVGFHVRNAMQAVFMNGTEGVTPRTMVRGVDLWSKFDRNPEAWLDALPEYVTKDQARDVVRAVFASGGGEGQFGKAELAIIGQSKITNNTWTRLSKRVGGKVEGSVRAALALHTVLGGGTWEEAASRISRIHFDYSQVSKFDAQVKRIIPFWTFLSRNVPLQVQQMFLKPRLYQAYKSLARNMGQDYKNNMVPLSWQESGAFQLTKGVWLAPGLAHLQLAGDLGKLTSDPMRLLADSNPLIKVPLETIVAKRKFFSDTPFTPGAKESVSGGGLQLLLPALKALGLTSTDPKTGDTVISDKLGYAIRSLNPLLTQSQRFAGTDPYYEDKRGQSALNYLGIPTRELTPGQKAAEEKRRKKAGLPIPKP